MRIGIITHHYINNYGAFQQAYAMQEVLTELFPEDTVEIINYINLKHYIINTCGWMRFSRRKENIQGWIQKIQVPYTFLKERHKYMKLSKLCFTVKQVNQLNYDYIVIGSDEVWNYLDKKINSRIKYGVGLSCKNIVSYAASVGQSKVDNKMPSYVREGLKNMKALSVRDDLSEDLVMEVIGRKPVRTLDPTFLIDRFPESTIEITSKNPYILFYYCDNLPAKVKKQILRYAHKNGLKVYGAGECDKAYSDVTVNLKPFEWCQMFREAECVFTGTFHGVVFSILNRKPFKVYLSNPSRLEKVSSLLRELNIQDRIIHPDDRIDLKEMKTEIDYDSVYQSITIKREKSIDYLLKSIRGY